MKISALLLFAGIASAQAQDARDRHPVARVQTAPATEQTLQDTITVYGDVRTDSAAERGINTPAAGRVVQLWVHAGQRVAAGAPLLELATDPSVQLSYRRARDQLKFASGELQRNREMFAGGLATRSQVAAAEKALADATSSLTAEERQGGKAGRVVLRASFAGTVSRVDVHAGDAVAGGANLLNLAASGHRIAVLGLEPDDVAGLPEHATVELVPVFGGASSARLQLDSVAGLIDPATHRVEAVVLLDESTPLLPGTRVRGRIDRSRSSGLAVPRVAVLNDGRDYLFVARDGSAHRIDVTRGIEDRGLIGIGGALRAGDTVVTQGQAILTEGMSVKDSGP